MYDGLIDIYRYLICLLICIIKLHDVISKLEISKDNGEVRRRIHFAVPWVK